MHAEYNTASGDSPANNLRVIIPQNDDPKVERDIETNDGKTDDDELHPNITVRNTKVSFFGIDKIEDEDDNGGRKTPRSPRKSRPSLGGFSSSIGSLFSFRSDSFDSGVLSAAMEGEETGLGQRNSSQRRIQFHQAKKLVGADQAKKLGRAVSYHYLKHMNDAKASNFDNWTKGELIRLLVEDKQCSLRDEENIDIVTLRDMAEAEYADEDETPRKPQPFSPFDIVLRNVMARRIQILWINYLVLKRIEKERTKSKVLQRRLTNMRSSMDLIDLSEEDIYHLNTQKQIIVGGTTIDIESGHNNIPLELFDDMPLQIHDPALLEEKRSESYDSAEQPTRELGLDAKSNILPLLQQQQQKRIRNILDIPWTAPDIDKAKLFANYLQPRKGGKGGEFYDLYDTHTGRHCCLGNCGEQFDLWKEGKVSEFSIYGSGVTNYFKFMKWGFWLFAMLTVLALPSMVINNTAADSLEGNRGLKSLARTTVGNLAYAFQNGTLNVNIPGCNTNGVYAIDCVFHGREISILYAILDIGISVIILFAFVWLRVFETEEEKELTKSTVTASMYTISVSNLPTNVTEVQLINHFTHLVGYNESVVAVSIAYDNLEEFKECKARGNIIHSKVNLVHELRYNCAKIREKYMTEMYGEQFHTNGAQVPPTPIGSHVLQSSSHGGTTTYATESHPPTFSESVVNRNEKYRLMEIAINQALEKFYYKMKLLNESLREKDKKLEVLSKESAHPIYAYITFNKVNDRIKIEKMYNRETWYGYLFDHKKLFLGAHLLKVRTAPEPSVIIWENLMFSMYERMKRRCFTTLSTLLLVIVSIVMIFSSKYLQQRATNNGSSTMTSCPSAWSTYTVTQKQQYVNDYENALHCYCDEYSTLDQSQDTYCQHYLEQNVESQVLIYFASFVILIINILMEKLLQFLSSFEKHHTSDSKEMSIFIRLFILKYINTAAVFLINNNNAILNKIYGLDSKGSPEFTANWYNTVGVTIILVQLGEVVNGHSETLLKYFLYNYRKARAIKENSKKSNMSSLEHEIPSHDIGVSSSRPLEASPGSSTALARIGHSNAHGTVLGGGGSAPVTAQPTATNNTGTDEKHKLNTTTNNMAYTQDLLNKLFVGPEFEFSHNYSQLITTIFVCLTFSTGIPVLYPIAAANFGIFYMTEKYFFIHLYKIPPHFNALVGKMATTLIPYALIIHIIMAIWVLSNDGLFRDHTNHSTSSSNAIDNGVYYYYGSSSENLNNAPISSNAFRHKLVEKITGYATLPLFITLLVVIAIILLMYITQSVTMGLERMYDFICGCNVCKKSNETTGKHENTNGINDRSYHNAVRRNLIKGLATYNILQNPVYKEAFGITWKFAVNNKEIRDVRNLQLRAEETINDNEVDATRVEELNQQAAVRNAPPDSPVVKTKSNFFLSWIPMDTQPKPHKRVTVKSVSRNRSFYSSFYQQQDDHVILETPSSDREQLHHHAVPATTGEGGGHAHPHPPQPPHAHPKTTGKERKEPEFHPEQLHQQLHLKTPGGVVKPTPVTIIPPAGKLKTNKPTATTVPAGKSAGQSPPQIVVPLTDPSRPLPTLPPTIQQGFATRGPPPPSQSAGAIRHPSPSHTVPNTAPVHHQYDYVPYTPGAMQHPQPHHHHAPNPSQSQPYPSNVTRRGPQGGQVYQGVPQVVPGQDYPVELDANGFQKHSFLLYNEPKHKHRK